MDFFSDVVLVGRGIGMGKNIVFHIDVNSAFLSWSAAYKVNILGAKLDLREIPAIVGGDQESRHGIVLAKSMPAKRFDIQTGEAIITAQQKCPGLIVIPPDYHLYVTASRALMELLNKYSDNVLQYSIDEAWAEFEGFEGLYGGIVGFANDLREEIRRELGFTVNIGVSGNKLLAKMAGDFKKPDFVHTLFSWEIEQKMWPLPVGHLFFVGRATEKKLHTLGIHTIGELAKTDVLILRQHLKKQGEIIWNYANGVDLLPYLYQTEANKGYGNSMTAPRDIVDIGYARQILLSLCETIGMRLRADKVKISCVAVSITTCLFERSSKQMTLQSATDITEEIYRSACIVFDRLWNGISSIRQIGVHTSKVSEDQMRQYHLFDMISYDKMECCNKAIDEIRKKYGEDSVMRAGFLSADIGHIGGGLDRERRTGITTGISLEKELQLS